MKRCVQNATRSVLYLAQPQLFTSTIGTDTFNSQGIVAKINGRSPAKHFTKVLLQSNMNYMPAIIILLLQDLPPQNMVSTTAYGTVLGSTQCEILMA